MSLWGQLKSNGGQLQPRESVSCIYRLGMCTGGLLQVPSGGDVSDVAINVPEIDFMPMYLAEVAELVALPD